MHIWRKMKVNDKMVKLRMLVFILLAGFFMKIKAQENPKMDSVQVEQIQVDSLSSNVHPWDSAHQFTYKKLIIPGVLIGYGVASLEIDGLKKLNLSTKEEILEHQPKQTKLDNFTQFAPALLVYGLNAIGVKGKHNFKDRTAIYGSSLLIATAFVIPLKHLVKEERPDQSNNLSFPSGHTAYAFASAQFMFREYKDTNFWLSISGYSFAAFTGIYRALNNKHWVGDIIGGAGFGILSTEMAYWLYPKVQQIFSKKSSNSTTMIMPTYQNKTFGLGLVKNF